MILSRRLDRRCCSTNHNYLRLLHTELAPALSDCEYGRRLQACADLSQARVLHRELLGSTALLETNVFIGNLLVGMYRSCGSLDEARAAFDGLKLRNVITWNTMLATLADHGEFGGMIDLFAWMIHEGTVPSVVSFVSVLKACVGLADFRSGTRVHALATELGFHADVVVGNVLVNLYGKCGELELARTIFAGICGKTTVSWTSMAAASSDNGDLCEALRLFRAMLLHGLRHNSPSFLTALHACCSIREAEEIHRQIFESSILEVDLSIANAVVKAYGKIGAVESAMEVFEKMGARNLSSWNAMLASFSQNGCSEDAIEFFSRMLLDGVVPDENSFAGGILSCVCGRTSMRLLRQCIEEGGFDNEIAVSNALISFYSKNGAVDEAGEIFQRLLTRNSSRDQINLVSWNSIISACVQNDCPDDAVLLFRKMQLHGFAADKFTLTSLLDACCSLSLGQQIVGWIETELKLRQQQDAFVAIAMLAMFAKCESPSQARDVFDKTINSPSYSYSSYSVKSIVLWNELIKSYLDNGGSEEAIQVFRLMLLESAASPNSITFARVLAAVEGDRSSAKVVEDLAMESGYGSDAQVSNALIGMLARNGFAERALDRVLSRERNNVVAWTATITGLVDRSLHGRAIEFFPVMRLEGTKPDALAFAAMLNACAAALDAAEGKKIHSQVLESGLEMDSIVASSLVGMYARCGSLVTAYKMLKSIEQEHHREDLPRTSSTRKVGRVLVVSWNNFIAGCIQHGHHSMAATMFYTMLLQGIDPNRVSFITVIALCCKDSSSRLRKIVHEACVESGHFRDVFLKNSLADMYGKLGELDRARRIFDQIGLKNAVAWNSLIAAFVQHGRGEDAEVFLREMQQDGSRPNSTTFASIVLAESSRAWGWIESMQVDHGLAPGVEHLRGLVEILGRTGKLGEAEGVISRTPAAIQIGLWMNLLGSCRRHGDVEREKIAARRILELDPLNATARQVATLYSL